MGRLDRRGRPGEKSNQDLRTLTDVQVASGTILPQQIHGNLQVNNMNISLNRTVQRIGARRKLPKMSQIINRYFNHGGVSPLFGKNPKISGEDDSANILPTTFAIILRGAEVRLPTINTGTYDFIVNWGDGTSDTITAWDQSELVHTYSLDGDYLVTIDGVFENLSYNSAENNPFKPTMIAILQWGSVSISGIWQAVFANCTNIRGVFAEDAPDLTACTQINGLFQGCSSLTTFNATAWVIPPGLTLIVNISIGCPLLTELNLNSWDVSNVITIQNIIQSQPPDTPLKIDQWTPTAANVFVITNGKVSTADYDAILDINTGIPSRVPYNSEIPFVMGLSTYTAAGDAAAGRSILTSTPYLWNITDGGPV